jgi:flagellar protein FlaJ
MNSYQRFCFKIFGDRLKKKRGDYLQLRNNLMRARITVPFEAYLASAYVTSFIVGISAAVLLGLFSYLMRIPEMITYKGTLPEVFVELSDYRLIFGTAAAVVLSLLIFGGVTYVIFLVYPSIHAGERRRNIDATLPYAINYITAMSTAGITPAEVFKLLGESPIYGESAVEARFIVREIEIFGKDLTDAIRIVAGVTPSDRMKEFLQGAVSAISAGTNLTDYYRNKAVQYAIENRQQQKIFLETLGLIAESYVTALVAGTLFLIILQSIMSIISGEVSPMFLYVVIYLIVPFGSIMFVILISSMTPEV